jgi:hypothetical protein
MLPEGKLARSLHQYALVWTKYTRIETTRFQISPRFIHYDADVEVGVSWSIIPDFRKVGFGKGSKAVACRLMSRS